MFLQNLKRFPSCYRSETIESMFVVEGTFQEDGGGSLLTQKAGFLSTPQFLTPFSTCKVHLCLLKFDENFQ